jgi:hypothetical protein
MHHGHEVKSMPGDAKLLPIEALHAALGREAFQPFRIVLTDGRSFVINDPERVEVRHGYEGDELRFYIEDTPADAPLLKEIKELTFDPAEVRTMSISEDAARHLLYLLKAAVECSMDRYMWVGHDQVVGLFREHWPELFKRGSAFAFLKPLAERR